MKGNAVETLTLIPKQVRRKFCYSVRLFHLLRGNREFFDYGDEPIAKYDGGRDRYGRKHTPVWPKIAKLILDREMNLDNFIAATFRSWEGQTHPAATYFLSEGAIQRYEDFKGADPRGRVDVLARELKVSTEVLLTKIEMEKVGGRDEAEAQASAILDPFAQVSPLFRLCAAVIGGHNRLVPLLLNDALTQYLGNRTAYDEAWDSFIPDILRQKADSEILEFEQSIND